MHTDTQVATLEAELLRYKQGVYQDSRVGLLEDELRARMDDIGKLDHVLTKVRQKVETTVVSRDEMAANLKEIQVHCCV